MPQDFPSNAESASTRFTDYSLCESENLETTGAFQSSGAVLVLDAQTHCVIGMSQNWPQVSDITDKSWPEERFVLTDLLKFPIELTRLQPNVKMCLTPVQSLLRHRKPFELQAHLKGNYLFIEWVATPVFSSLHQRKFTTERPRPELARSPQRNIYQTLQQFCGHVQEVLGLDRVIIYQFDADQAGDVVAESCRPDWTPYLGLHYPASDIPQVARDLYLKVPLRHIYDAMAPLSGLLTLPEHPASKIDLTFCSLRSVSPYHLEYLQNMGVRATLSIAIRHAGKLWGLMVCHHAQPLYLPLVAKQYMLETVSQLEVCLSDWLAFRKKTEQDALDRFYVAQQEHLKSLASDDALSFLETILLGDYALEVLLQADATAIYADGVISATGNIPDGEWIHHFVQHWIQSEDPEIAAQDLFVSNRIKDEKLTSQPFSSENSGMLALRICDSPSIVLFVFRQEYLHDVHWGGNPYRENDLINTPFSPRRSFQLWKETVRHQPRPWSIIEQESIRKFKAVLLDHFKPQQLKPLLKAGTRELIAQVRQHGYVAKTLSNGIKNGVAMTILESSEASSTVLHLNKELQKMLVTSPEENDAHTRSVEDTLFDLGLTAEQIDNLGAIPQRIQVWSARLGHRTVKMSRLKILSYYDAFVSSAIVVFQFFDITAEERVEQSLRAAHRQVDQADSAKLRFLTHTSNELLMPLKEVIRLGHGLHEELSQMALDDLLLYTEKISSAGKHMLNRVEQLLFFARSASGHLLLDLESVDLQALLQNCVSWLADFSHQKGVTIRCEASHVVLVTGNRESLHHLFMNLLDNAVRYSHAGGIVFCHLRQDTAGHVLIEIDDQGKGMTEQELSQAFIPYYTGDVQQEYPEREGSGLGLTLVKHIVEAHRGSVNLTSSVNSGTQVRVLLPQEQLQKTLDLDIPYYGA